MKHWHNNFPFSLPYKFFSIFFNAIVRFLNENRFPIVAALGLRFATSIWLAFIWLFIEPYFPKSELAFRETYNLLKIHHNWFGRAFIDVWLRWDAVHYMNLAWGGYENAGSADMNFWPFYPYLIHFLQPVLLNETVLTGLIVSTIATVISAIYFRKFVLLLYRDKTLANTTILVWILFPTSFFLVAPYTEALFAALSITALWNIAQRKWIIAGILCALAGFTRSQGILLSISFFIFVLYDWFSKTRQKSVKAIFGIVISPLGTIGFMVWRWARGMPDFFSSYSIYSAAQTLDPISSAVLAIKRLVVMPDLINMTELLSVSVFLIILIWMFLQPVFRKHSFFLIHGILTIFFILIKHNLIASPLQSSNRYVINVFPAFVGIAYLLEHSTPKIRFIYNLISIILAMIATVLYAMWVFVG